MKKRHSLFSDFRDAIIGTAIGLIAIVMFVIGAVTGLQLLVWLGVGLFLVMTAWFASKGQFSDLF